ncbi:glycine oxidase ThiO [Tomitella fengzijianii]|uniref:glycine oxidase n=1 Tax=Tomitella fengzijianii TaxID=2597660 RepID=A0A516X5N2_9ACTN|nr:glycine oxidase ThiO [Tomitella fengzijianii]QDQ98382.1 glycine oxidase ThiO [Tomitella fengzijianii]
MVSAPRCAGGDRVDVVGAGIVGSAIAWRAARAGYAVRLIDPLLEPGAPQTGASWAAGGMLAPYSEGRPGEERVLELGAASLSRWPALARTLHEETGVDVVTARGTLMVGADGADADELRGVGAWLDGAGVPRASLTRAQVRERHRGLARNLRGGQWLPGEFAVDNRALLRALRTAAVDAGAVPVASRCAAISDSAAEHLVVTAGAHVPSLLPGLPVRPVKGEILRLRRPASVPPPPACTVRASVHGRHVYLVPRADGLVVGATMYEHGEDRAVTVGGVRDLIADAQVVLPSIAEYELVDAMAGLRPMTPDNLPVIGPVEDAGDASAGGGRGPRVIAAAGHGRNGVLLTAVTVDAVLAELAGTTLAEADGLGPQRFGQEGFGRDGSRRYGAAEAG